MNGSKRVFFGKFFPCCHKQLEAGYCIAYTREAFTRHALLDLVRYLHEINSAKQNHTREDNNLPPEFFYSQRGQSNACHSSCTQQYPVDLETQGSNLQPVVKS
jgi:hypothetical protein